MLHSSSISIHWRCYTCLVQYSNMLKNSNKQIMPIKYLINLSSLPTQSTLSINLAIQTSSLPLSLTLTIDWAFSINLAFLPWLAPIPLFIKYSSSSASSTQTKNSQLSSSYCTKKNQNQSTIKMHNIKQHITIVKQTFGKRARIERLSWVF